VTTVGVAVAGAVVGVFVGVLGGVLVGVLVGVFVGVLLGVGVDVPGVTPSTARQRAWMPFVTLVTVTPAAVLVKAAGLPVQSGFNCPDAFVTLTVTVQVELPAGT